MTKWLDMLLLAIALGWSIPWLYLGAVMMLHPADDRVFLCGCAGVSQAIIILLLGAIWQQVYKGPKNFLES